MQTVSVIGLGKLGACLAALLNANNYPTYGYDINSDICAQIESKKSPYKEQFLDEQLKKGSGIVIANPDELMQKSDVTFIILPTPSKSCGRFDNSYLSESLRALAKALAQKDRYHVFSIVSTVMPGSCINEFIPLIENESGKKLGRDFGLCYNPAFIALGNVINGIRKPDVVLLGQSDEKAGGIIHNILKSLLINDAPIKRVSLSSAEISKIALNSYITMKISFANFLGIAANAVDGADIAEILDTVGSDSRVGKKYLSMGTPFGGPCFPRDNRAFSMFTNDVVSHAAPLASATDHINKLVTDTLIKHALSNLNGNEQVRILVIGLAYKPGTTVCEESFSVELIRQIKQQYPHSHIIISDTCFDQEDLPGELQDPNLKITLDNSPNMAEMDLVICTHPLDADTQEKVTQLPQEKLIKFWP